MDSSGWIAKWVGGAVFLNIILLVFLVLLAGAFLATGLGWEYLLQFLGEEQKSGVLSFIGITMGGTLLALNAVAAHRRSRAMEAAAKAQAQSMHEQASANQLTERGRRQDRLKNAIEHLGHESRAVRLGGAYELSNLAQDTPGFRQTVLDILCAHIRRTTGEEDYQKQYSTKPSLEIQDLLSLVFVREPDVFSACRITLSESWLNGADLRRARLWNADLCGVQLRKGVLDDAHVQKAALLRADLRGSSLSRASLQCANLLLARMDACYLLRAQLQGAMIAGGNLTGAYLGGALMQGADFSSTSMYGANLVNTKMQAAALPFSSVQGAIFRDTDCRGVRGTDWSPAITFDDRIKQSIGVDADLSHVAFAGGINRNRVRQLVDGIAFLDQQKAEVLAAQLEPHIDQDCHWGVPEGVEVVTGAFAESEANDWIAKYGGEMSGIPAST